MTELYHHCIRILSRACNVEVEREQAGFAEWMRCLTNNAVNSNQTPPAFDFVLSYRRQTPTGFAYLTAGHAASSAALRTDSLQRAVSEFSHYTASTHVRDAIDRQFALCFPNRDWLASVASDASAALIGITNADPHHRVKAYFNTRLDPTTPHRSRIQAMLHEAVTDTSNIDRIYDSLYASHDDVNFHGVGLDFDQDGSQRAKLYVRLPTARALAYCETLLIGVTQFETINISAAIRAIEQTLEVLASQAASDFEVGVGLQRDKPASLKVTALTKPTSDLQRALTATETWLEQQHACDAEPLRQLVPLLAQTNDPGFGMFGLGNAQPIYGLGLEFTNADTPKVNLYLR